MNLPLKVLTVKHVAIMIKGLGFLVKKLSSTSFATNPQSVSFISFPLFKFSKIYVRWNQDTFFIMFPLVQLISFLLTHVSKMYQFSYGSNNSLCELKKKKKKTTWTMFPQVHPINYYLIGKTVEGGRGHQPQMCHLQHLHIVQYIGHNILTYQYTALLPIIFIYIIYPKPKSNPSITKNSDIYFQSINRAKPKWNSGKNKSMI